jgi:nicotinamide-nucleotide amidase
MIEMVKKTFAILGEKDWHISFAESCTGGLAAATLVALDGSSSVFDGSFVTYANESKVKYLGVKEEDILAYGVVSEVVAGQMAKGCATAYESEVGVGISGIAGPTGGTPTKPVGTVCFGFYVDGALHTRTCHFANLDRQGVREAAVAYVYETLRELL